MNKKLLYLFIFTLAIFFAKETYAGTDALNNVLQSCNAFLKEAGEVQNKISGQVRKILSMKVSPAGLLDKIGLGGMLEKAEKLKEQAENLKEKAEKVKAFAEDAKEKKEELMAKYNELNQLATEKFAQAKEAFAAAEAIKKEYLEKLAKAAETVQKVKEGVKDAVAVATAAVGTGMAIAEQVKGKVEEGKKVLDEANKIASDVDNKLGINGGEELTETTDKPRLDNGEELTETTDKPQLDNGEELTETTDKPQLESGEELTETTDKPQLESGEGIAEITDKPQLDEKVKPFGRVKGGDSLPTDVPASEGIKPGELMKPLSADAVDTKQVQEPLTDKDKGLEKTTVKPENENKVTLPNKASTMSSLLKMTDEKALHSANNFNVPETDVLNNSKVKITSKDVMNNALSVKPKEEAVENKLKVNIDMKDQLIGNLNKKVVQTPKVEVNTPTLVKTNDDVKARKKFETIDKKTDVENIKLNAVKNKELIKAMPKEMLNAK